MAEKTVVLNIRLPEMQARWLKNLADAEYGGNMSAAARKALSDGWMMRRCREEFATMREHEGFSFPRNEDGTTRVIEFLLSSFGAKSEHLWDEQDAEWV